MNSMDNSQRVSSMYIPHVLDKRSGEEKIWDLWSRLHADRIVFIGEEINDYNANIVVGQLLQLEADNREKPISIYINSPGGVVSAGLAILDAMNYITPDISTVCMGSAASMAAVLLSAGTKGMRFCFPNSSVMIHQVSGGASGQVTNLEIQLAQARMLKKKLNHILADNTEQTYERVCEDTERDHWFTAEEAKEYGIIDGVLLKRDVILK